MTKGGLLLFLSFWLSLSFLRPVLRSSATAKEKCRNLVSVVFCLCFCLSFCLCFCLCLCSYAYAYVYVYACSCSLASSLCEFLRISQWRFPYKIATCLTSSEVKRNEKEFCNLGNRTVTDSRNEAWKTLRPFGTFQPMKSTEQQRERMWEEDGKTVFLPSRMQVQRVHVSKILL